MTVTNDFLPFATGAGANVVTPATWASTTARQTGFQSGTASSALANTALRQANFVTAMVAQFIADTLAQNVADNGNLATLETQFISAIQQSVGSPAQAAFWHFGRDTGPVNVMQVAAAPIITGYSDGMMLATIPQFSNTVSNPTLSANGLTATVIVNADGTALIAGDILINSVIVFEYDATLVKWRIISQAIPQSSQLHSGTDIGTPNAIIATLTPPIGSYAGGSIYNVKIATGNSCTGASTANFNGLGAKTITRADGTATKSGDYIAGQELYLTYDGANIQISNYLSSHLPAQAATIYTPGSYTFVPPAGVYVIKQIELWGAGSGGAGSNGQAGAGGGYCRAYNVPCTPGVGIAVVVGVGGVAGVGTGNGGPGGTSTFGALLTATGGTGGLYATLALNAGVGTGTGGVLNVSGMPGAGAPSTWAQVTPGGGAFGTSGSLCVGGGGPAYDGSFPGGGGAGGNAGNGGKGSGGMCAISY